MAYLEPVEEAAGTFIEALVKSGQVYAAIEFVLTWTGGGFLSLASGKDADVHTALFYIGLGMAFVGALSLIIRTVRNALKRRQRWPALRD